MSADRVVAKLQASSRTWHSVADTLRACGASRRCLAEAGVIYSLPGGMVEALYGEQMMRLADEPVLEAEVRPVRAEQALLVF